MSFTREEKRINQQSVFNPPPGYYQPNQIKHNRPAPSFGQSDRFIREEISRNPGPGAYYNNQKDVVKKRLIQQSQRKQGKGPESGSSNGIKISSIPSIPKKSATRVYQELAPGILILHQEQYQNSSVGPGSYNITDKMTYHKPVAHRIAPQHCKKIVQEEHNEVSVPTMAEEIRNQKRMMNKQNIYKTSTVNKSQINPSDLCLEVIILREKLLRSDENPPPGYYSTEHMSDFRSVQEKKAENQVMGGKEKRFDDSNKKIVDEVGPGTYLFEEQGNAKGGFIPRQVRKLNQISEDKPGPGAYITVKPQQKVQTKGNYPPIFGSGIMRFPSAPKKMQTYAAPGPGSYKLDKKKFKKQKYIKIRKQLIEPTRQQLNIEPLAGIQGDFSQISNAGSVKQRKLFKYQKNSSNFKSNVQRFQSERNINEVIGPGNYDTGQNSFAFRSFNRMQNGYVGNRMARFDQTQVRPKVGPGTYNPGFETVKEKKIKNVYL